MKRIGIILLTAFLCLALAGCQGCIDKFCDDERFSSHHPCLCGDCGPDDDPDDPDDGDDEDNE